MALIVAISPAYARTQRNSFLNKPVSDAQQLVTQIEKDPEVRSRFSRHFAMNVAELKRYFGALRVARLAKDGAYAVYNVPDSGELRVKQRFLKKGTAVFVDRTGTPILLVVCGNPLTTGPNNPVAFDFKVQDLVMPGPSELQSLTAELLPATPEQTLLVLARPDVPTFAEIVPTNPPLVTPPVNPPTVVTTGGEAGAVVVSPPAIGALPILFLVGGGGGGQRATPIPEPASWLALAGGAAAFAAISRRRHRSR
jgi:hypothetical protein